MIDLIIEPFSQYKNTHNHFILKMFCRRSAKAHLMNNEIAHAPTESIEFAEAVNETREDRLTLEGFRIRGPAIVETSNGKKRRVGKKSGRLGCFSGNSLIG
jgi:hypothetical protein